MPGKYFIAGVVVILVLALGAALVLHLGGKSLTQKPEQQQQQPPAPTTATYSTTTFSIVYPIGYTVDESYAYQGVPKKPIKGVKFVIPEEVATGTNLATDSGVSVESLPRAKKCTADIYFEQNVKASDMTIGSSTYSVASSTGAAAGNFYEEYVYAINGSNPCIAVRYLIHSGNIANYPPNTVREFDRGALLGTFDTIRDSLQLH